MTKMFVILFLFVLSFRLCAQQPDVRAGENAPSEAEVKALEAKLASLIVKAEWDEYAKNLASDYIHTRENGVVENKSEALASLRDGKRKIIVMEMEPADSKVLVYGDTALANAEFTVTVRDGGQVRSRRTRLTDVYVKRDGIWFLISGQDTTIGK